MASLEQRQRPRPAIFCDLCGKGFKNDAARKAHLAGAHLDPKKPDTSRHWCRYCLGALVLHTSSEAFYRGRDFGPLWACEPCGAWVGCHPGTYRPLGGVANPELRKLKHQAHTAFDPLWQTGLTTRGTAYALLAQELGIPVPQCHIGFFDEDLCRRTIAAVPHIAVLLRDGPMHEAEAIEAGR